jgi:hypothetical protein
MKTFKNTFLCCLCCACNLLFAQTNTRAISGKVSDTAGKPVALAAVLLRSLPDSALVKAAYTEEDGRFSFSELKAGNCLLEIKFLGFQSWYSGVLSLQQPNTELGEIVLKEASTQLSGVTVSAKKPYIERKIDRTIVNVDALITNTGSNALEALEKAPGVSVDPNAGILLKGRSGVLILIDDKPTYLSGTELENYLKSLPTGSIKQIEIMTNPPAKYEAAGNAGVINIVTKRNQLKGFYGNLSLVYAQGRYARNNNSLNLNYNRQKLSLYANINGGIQNNFQDLNINRYYRNADQSPASSFAQNSYIRKGGKSFSTKLGFDWYLTNRTTLGGSIKGSVNPNFANTANTALVRDANRELLKTVLADNKENSTFNNGTFNLNLRHNFDSSGTKITVDADYVLYQTGNDQDFYNYIYLPGNVLDYNDKLTGRLPSDIRIYAVKTDFTKPFKNGLNVEAGLKTAFTKTDNEAAYSTTLNGTTAPNYDLSNRFLYDEWIHAAYLNATKSFGKFDLQIGLRGENTQLKGQQLGNVQKPDSSFQRSYSSLFPTFYLSYKLDAAGNNVLSANYGRRIDRPYFQDLNPFISPLDKFTYYTGNPNLLPTYSHNFSLTHSWKSRINTTLGYSKTLDGINETLEIQNGIYYSRPNNTAESTNLNLALDAAIPIVKWWNTNLYVEAGHVEYSGKLYTEQLDAKGNYISTQISNTFQFGKGWSAELRGNYQSDIVYAQLIIKGFGTLYAGLQKNILQNKGTVKVSVSDILYTRRGDGIINYLRLTDADWNSRFDSRAFYASFSYRFGKPMGEKPRYKGSGSESEQGRVKG